MQAWLFSPLPDWLRDRYVQESGNQNWATPFPLPNAFKKKCVAQPVLLALNPQNLIGD